ncbi:unnamed protein product [Blepharisma stoltei]|uniref:Translin-associated factor X-interacting protein 1 N-terminal domain-containing protein n=1 Tax=Blepharisma stoltei TaxID=1481888 RepID=A0AAU9JAP2_9CILI|nr:unnamed protein product [Blepharisma stoltei]
MSHNEKPQDKVLRIRSGTPQGRSSLQRSRSPLIEQTSLQAINLKSKIDIQLYSKDAVRTLTHENLSKSRSQSRLKLNSSLKAKSPESLFTTSFADIEQTNSDYATPSTKSTIEKHIDIYAFESKINYHLQRFGEESATSFDKFKIYNQMWDELISIENPYSKVMRQIKNGYDEWINFLEKELKTKTSEIAALNSKLKEEAHTLKLFRKRFKKLAIENMELNSNLSDKNKENDLLQEKIDSLKVILKNEKKNNKEVIKDTKNDNDTLKELLKQSKDYAKELKQRLKIFRDLVNAVKSNGIPVEDIYNQIVKSKARPAIINSIDSKISFGSSNSLLNQMSSKDLDHLSTIDFIYSPSAVCSDIGEILTYKESNEDSVFNALSEIKDV